MIMTEQTVSSPSITGKVVSTKMDKTIVVLVERKVKHPLYGKFMKRFSRMKAHDNDNICQVGDIVEIKQCRPISKTKNWVLVKVEKKQGGVE
jgi:small subunit ribosomal protein S17